MRSAARLLAPLLVAATATWSAPRAGELPDAVRVVVEQSYEFRQPTMVNYAPIEGLALPVGDLVEDMLFAADIEPLLDGDEGEADGVIRVVLRGRAIGGTYFEPVRDFLYTGAQIAGEVFVERPGAETVRRDFLAEKQRPFHISINLGYEDPANAPFAEVLEMPGGFIRELAEAMAASWGLAVVVPSLFEHNPALRYNVATLLGDIGDPAAVPDLVAALGDGHDRVRWEAVWSLGRIGDPVAIPELVAALDDPSEDVRWFASWSLREITGADPGPDAEAWRAWLAEQGGLPDG